MKKALLIIFLGEIDIFAQSGEKDMHETIRRISPVFRGILDGFDTSDVKW